MVKAHFLFQFKKNNKYKSGWRIKARFQIGLHVRDISLLYQIQEFFDGIGSIYKEKNNNMVHYEIAGVNDLINILIPHFICFPLLTQKAADFILFKRIVDIMFNKDHLFIEGLQQIINIKASMNLGLSDIIKSDFNNIIPVERPIILITNIPDPNWISGFVTGEGSFDVSIKQSKNKIGYQVLLRFRISQHQRDIKLIELIINYLGSGKIEKDSRHPVVSLKIVKLSDITKIIIPLFPLPQPPFEEGKGKKIKY
jgi:hypothetical protein